jgi:hypothetical protein
VIGFIEKASWTLMVLAAVLGGLQWWMNVYCATRY